MDLPQLPRRPPGRLHGRASEQAAIDGLLRDARDGRSGALVVRGETGIGKSALLEYAGHNAAHMRILRGVGVETEAKLAFAGLHMMVGRYTRLLGRLPHPQAAALRRAFGLADAPPADRFLAGLATLSLLSELADDAPLLCLVDDAHWLDQASADALLIAARRLDAEGIAMIFAARDEHPFPAPGLAQLHLSGIDGTAGAALLAEHSRDLADHVRSRILEEAHGNPLALLELPAALTPAQRAGEQPPDAFHIGTQPISGRLQETFNRRLVTLPEQTQLLLLIAAADDTSELNVVLKAGEPLGVDETDLESAERTGLIRIIRDELAFRHPLVRSAAYRGATTAQRLHVHRALAEIHGEIGNGDRRAWHLAAATIGPDEAVAAELERTAEQSRTRGGHAAVAAAYHRAAHFTPDPGRRAARLAAGARAAASAGQAILAGQLAEEALPHTTDPVVRADLVRVRAAIAYERDHQSYGMDLLEAASGVAEQLPATAALMFFAALTGSWRRGDCAAGLEAVARATSMTSSDPFLARVTAAVAHLAADDLQQGVPLLRELLDEFRNGLRLALWERVDIHWWFEWMADVKSGHEETVKLVGDCRAQGAFGLLPRALLYLARSQLLLGRYRDLLTTAAEGLRISQDTSQPHYAAHLSGLLACVAAIEGDEQRCCALTEEIEFATLNERCLEGLHALNLLDIAYGRHDQLMRRFAHVAPSPTRNLALAHVPSLPDYVEAAVRTGALDLATESCRRFTTFTNVTGQAWAGPVELRCRALLAESDEADGLYAQAVQLHRTQDHPFERARTELLYGEWLRRQRQRAGARPHLRSALELFQQLGAVPWAERAHGELRATGETLQDHPVTPHLLDRLTAQELQVARLAATGLSNREIAAQLFLSPRTVGYHLYKAYPKLGIASRNDLMRMALD
ncbi:helix-turn-helix transcriptional regulator [Nonomuraea basaltis]|uniref:helix-turn-helix transcriptional regulator n=1 Tax=Nonomuraea basaltis TaxID=2495887 RepID=UPI00110C707C|nr:LuxR family transcriptional regulator [Nonomuraea basaltis]TMR94253.1 helix-turn-helix transcriptional regulator [Nonomuraea basaltis]